MRKDYAGCVDKKGWDDPEQYRRNITKIEQEDKLTPERFAEIVQDYLLDFKDKHMGFMVKRTKQKKSHSIGFVARRHKDKLYVTRVTKEKRLRPGDAIVSLDGKPILSLVEKHKRQLMETVAEREEWKDIIKRYSRCEVVDQQGNIRSLKLKKHKKEKYVPTYSLDEINSDTLLLTLTDFANPERISTFIKKCEPQLSQAENLIIDIRVNYGGSDLSFSELLPYLFEEIPNIDRFNEDYEMEFNCSERNYQLISKRMKQQLSKLDEDQSQQLSSWFNTTWEKHRGKGFVSFGGMNPSSFPAGRHQPKNIVVLTDVMCGSTGDIFAYISKISPKVKVIGRRTAGLNDYSNLTKMEWDQFEFMYPISRLKQLNDRDDEDFTHGIRPHIFIPWTPEHIERDVDMEKALELLVLS